MHERQHLGVFCQVLELLPKQVERFAQHVHARGGELGTDRKIPRLWRELVIHGLIPAMLTPPVLTHHAHELPIRKPLFQALDPHFDAVDEPERQHLRDALRVVDPTRQAPRPELLSALDVRQLLDAPGDFHELQKALAVRARCLLRRRFRLQKAVEPALSLVWHSGALPARDGARGDVKRAREAGCGFSALEGAFEEFLAHDCLAPDRRCGVQKKRPSRGDTRRGVRQPARY